METKLTKKQADELVDALYELSNADLWATGLTSLRMLLDRFEASRSLNGRERELLPTLKKCVEAMELK